jgi:hypothetical protein
MGAKLVGILKMLINNQTCFYHYGEDTFDGLKQWEIFFDESTHKDARQRGERKGSASKGPKTRSLLMLSVVGQIIAPCSIDAPEDSGGVSKQEGLGVIVLHRLMPDARNESGVRFKDKSPRQVEYIHPVAEVALRVTNCIERARFRWC